MGDMMGGASSKDTYGKPHNSWRLRGEKIVENFMHLNSAESALNSVHWIYLLRTSCSSEVSQKLLF